MAVNTILRKDDYRFVVEDSECAAVLYSPEFSDAVEGALGEAAHKPGHAMPVEGGGLDAGPDGIGPERAGAGAGDRHR